MLKRELALAKAENNQLQLQLSNIMVLLKREMMASGTLPDTNMPRNQTLNGCQLASNTSK